MTQKNCEKVHSRVHSHPEEKEMLKKIIGGKKRLKCMLPSYKHTCKDDYVSK